MEGYQRVRLKRRDGRTLTCSAAIPFFRHPGSERSETPGPSGAEGDLFRPAVVDQLRTDRVALSRAAGSRGPRGCAACPGMTKGRRGRLAPVVSVVSFAVIVGMNPPAARP